MSTKTSPDISRYNSFLSFIFFSGKKVSRTCKGRIKYYALQRCVITMRRQKYQRRLSDLTNGSSIFSEMRR